MDQQTSPPQYSLTRETSSSIAAWTAVRSMSFTPSVVSRALMVCWTDYFPAVFAPSSTQAASRSLLRYL